MQPSGRLRFAEGRTLDWKIHASSIAARALTTVYRRMLCLVYPLQGRTIPVYRSQIDVDFRVLTKRDVTAYTQFRPKHGRENFERNMSRGDRCFASWHEGRIVDAGWTATGTVFVPYLGRFILLEAGDIYSYGAYTLPGYRGYGLYMARNSYTARRNQKEGFERSVALVAPENYAAWLILTRSGLETIGEYARIRLPVGGIWWDRAAPGCMLPRIASDEREGEARSTNKPVAAA